MSAQLEADAEASKTFRKCIKNVIRIHTREAYERWLTRLGAAAGTRASAASGGGEPGGQAASASNPSAGSGQAAPASNPTAAGDGYRYG